jgi:hypothetical protein
MKIAFIFAYEREVWSTPLGLAQEFKKNGHEVSIITIGSNKTGYYYDDNISAWLLTENAKKTDLVIYMDWGRFDSRYLDKNRLPNACWIKECGDDPQNYDRHIKQAYKFDHLFTPDYDSYIRYSEAGYPTNWINHWADTSIYYPSKRRLLNSVVTSRGPGFEFFSNLERDIPGFVNKNNMIGREHAEFLANAFIVVQKSRWGEITRRIFEAAACGTMVITDRLNESKKLHKMFKDGESIVYYDNYQDCVDKIKYYLNDSSLIERIAFNGLSTVLKYYTQQNVYDTIMRIYEAKQLYDMFEKK